MVVWQISTESEQSYLQNIIVHFEHEIFPKFSCKQILL